MSHRVPAWVPVMLLILACISPLAAEDAPSTATGSNASALTDVPDIGSDVLTLDGRVDEAAWRLAAKLVIDQPVRARDQHRKILGSAAYRPVLTGDTADARMVMDKENLYISFVCRKSHEDGPYLPKELAGVPRGRSWRWSRMTCVRRCRAWWPIT